MTYSNGGDFERTDFSVESSWEYDHITYSWEVHDSPQLQLDVGAIARVSLIFFAF